MSMGGPFGCLRQRRMQKNAFARMPVATLAGWDQVTGGISPLFKYPDPIKTLRQAQTYMEKPG